MIKHPHIVFFCFVLIIFFSILSNANADPWLDQVVTFQQPDGSSNEGGSYTEALGSADSKYVSIDDPEILIVSFRDNFALNGVGNDLEIYEISNGDSNVEIYVSEDNINYTYLGKINKNTQFDFEDYSIKFVNYIKFVGLDDGGGDAGFDLDAVKALHTEFHDSDKDGVIDAWDHCPNTPITVTENGLFDKFDNLETIEETAIYPNGCSAIDLYQTIKNLDTENNVKDNKIIELQSETSALELSITKLNLLLQNKDLFISEISSKLSESNEMNISLQSAISNLNNLLDSRDTSIQEKNLLISNLKNEVYQYKNIVQECSKYRVTLSSGWHLISSIYQSATPKTIPEGCIDVMYAFNNGAYNQVTIFKPNHGYWVKINDSCDSCEFILEP